MTGEKGSSKKVKLELELEKQYLEIMQQTQIIYTQLSETSSLAQPSPAKALPTVVTYGAYEPPIVGLSQTNINA